MTSLSKINYKIIFHLMGLLLVVNGAFMMAAVFASWYYGEEVLKDILMAAAVALGAGAAVMLVTKNHTKEVQKREGYIIVAFGWIFMAAIGTLPYIFSGAIPNFTNAFFETMSGYTTTGATVLSDIESVPRGILLWRSTTHWIGGMGIIVLAIAILPLLGIGGMQLFAAEAPGPSGDKLHPRITDTAKRLWLIYVGYTLAETILLKVAGMSLFDAINHSLSTLSSGGFSTKNASVAYWNDRPLIQYIIIFFMFLAGTNFVLSYFAFKRRFQKIIHDEEFQLYTFLVVALTAVSAFIIYYEANYNLSGINHPMVYGPIESAVRHSLFQVVSVMTTTGFVSADFTQWTPFLTLIFFGIMFIGGCAGSTSGGIKVMRHLIMIKNGILEFKRTLHPHAILPVRYNSKAVPQPIVFNILGFFILYMLSFIFGTLVFSWLGLDFNSSLGGAATLLGNIGPGLGSLGPVENYGALPGAAKWWGSFLMLIGRLELFTVLILLTPFFWRNR